LANLGLAYLVAFWAISTGIIEVVASLRLRREIPGELLLGVAGATSILLGVLMLAWPRAGAVVAAWMLGWYAFSFGAIMLTLAFRLSRMPYSAPASLRPDVKGSS